MSPAARDFEVWDESEVCVCVREKGARDLCPAGPDMNRAVKCLSVTSIFSFSKGAASYHGAGDGSEDEHHGQ